MSRWRAARLSVALAGVLGLSAATVSLAPSSVRAAEPERSVHRFALFVGANDGGGDRERLLYAGSDVQAVAKALADLGGVEADDRIILEDPSAAALERGFAEISKRIEKSAAAGERIQFIFYYSGHSDESGLLLGGVHVDYKSLRSAIDRVPADVRIGILDSCSSGAFTRFKGGSKRAPFLVGSAAEVRGHAFLTSSSADEAAQESDRIGGSFFTHFLVTGLRGAADTDGDRRVTLNEAYRFAFDETLARTEVSAGGPQHAAYDIELAGSGDLVMTDLRQTSAKLEIAADIHGRLYIRDREGKLAAELFKPDDAGAITLALEPGEYTITVDDGRTLTKATVRVRAKSSTTLEPGQLRGIEIEDTRLRGDPAPGLKVAPFNIGVAPRAETNSAFGDARVLNHFSLSLGVTRAARIEGMQAALGMAWTTERSRGIQAGAGAAYSEGTVSGMQTSAGLSLADAQVLGTQLGLVAITRGRLSGAQFGLVNYVAEARGAQLGLVNVSRDSMAGGQTGLVNIAGDDVDVQLGLINVADEAEASIGLIPYTRQGGVWLDLWTSDVQVVNVALRFRAKRTYTYLGGGVHPFGGEDREGWSAGLGFGGPLLQRKALALELDNGVFGVTDGLTNIDGAPHLLDTLRLSLAYRPAKRFAIWGAVTGNLLLDFSGRAQAFRPGYGWSYTALHDNNVRLQVWPGFALGVQI